MDVWPSGGGNVEVAKRKAERKNESEPAAGTDWIRWLDVVPLIWMVLVISAYALVVLYPTPNSSRLRAGPIPGVAELEGVLGPLLFGLILAAIIRYFLRRQTEGSERDDETAPRPDPGRETA